MYPASFPLNSLHMSTFLLFKTFNCRAAQVSSLVLIPLLCHSARNLLIPVEDKGVRQQCSTFCLHGPDEWYRAGLQARSGPVCQDWAVWLWLAQCATTIPQFLQFARRWVTTAPSPPHFHSCGEPDRPGDLASGTRSGSWAGGWTPQV